MLAIPTVLRVQFEERLLQKAIPRKAHWFFMKWLRYYLDFCKEYGFPDAKKESLAPSGEHAFSKDVRQCPVKEAPFAAPASHSPSSPSAKPIPEDS